MRTQWLGHGPDRIGEHQPTIRGLGHGDRAEEGRRRSGLEERRIVESVLAGAREHRIAFKKIEDTGARVQESEVNKGGAPVGGTRQAVETSPSWPEEQAFGQTA